MLSYASGRFGKHLKNRQIPYQSVKGPLAPLGPKMKVAFHEFHPIGLLGEWSKYKILTSILLFLLLW